MLEFRKYPVEAPEGTEPPACVVTYPEPCGRPAVGEVWDLAFCEAHGQEAVYAAQAETKEDASYEVDALLTNTLGRVVRNPLVRKELEDLRFTAGLGGWQHEKIIGAAYLLDESLTDPDTLVYDYDSGDAADSPYDWWSEHRELLVRFMREAHEAGQPELLRELEGLRERATVQQELARFDYERRYVEPRRAAREERRRREAERDPSAEILGTVNGKLGSAIDLLDDVPPEVFGDRDGYFRAKQSIAEAGGLVATAQNRRKDRPAG